MVRTHAAPGFLKDIDMENGELRTFLAARTEAVRRLPAQVDPSDLICIMGVEFLNSLQRGLSCADCGRLFGSLEGTPRTVLSHDLVVAYPNQVKVMFLRKS